MHKHHLRTKNMKLTISTKKNILPQVITLFSSELFLIKGFWIQLSLLLLLLPLVSAIKTTPQLNHPPPRPLPEKTSEGPKLSALNIPLPSKSMNHSTDSQVKGDKNSGTKSWRLIRKKNDLASMVGDGRPPTFNDGILKKWGPINPYGIGLMSLSPIIWKSWELI